MRDCVPHLAYIFHVCHVALSWWLIDAVDVIDYYDSASVVVGGYLNRAVASYVPSVDLARSGQVEVFYVFLCV